MSEKIPGRRFIRAWHQAERAEAGAETHLSFQSWEPLARTLTPKRLALLRDTAMLPAAVTVTWGAG